MGVVLHNPNIIKDLSLVPLLFLLLALLDYFPFEMENYAGAHFCLVDPTMHPSLNSYVERT
jgi:hypothetical protein